MFEELFHDDLQFNGIFFLGLYNQEEVRKVWKLSLQVATTQKCQVFRGGPTAVIGMYLQFPILYYTYIHLVQLAFGIGPAFVIKKKNQTIKDFLLTRLSDQYTLSELWLEGPFPPSRCKLRDFNRIMDEAHEYDYKFYCRNEDLSNAEE